MVPDRFAQVLQAYAEQLDRVPLSVQTRRTYLSKVRQFLVWLDAYAAKGDPLGEKPARDWAVRDYRTHLLAVAKREPATVNNALAAIDDFYTRRGLGPADAKRVELLDSAPRTLEPADHVAFLREVERWPEPRDRALALVPFYAGARISEAVGLDVEDVRMSHRIGELRLYGKGGKVRTVPLKPQLRTALATSGDPWASRVQANERHPAPRGAVYYLAEISRAIAIVREGLEALEPIAVYGSVRWIHPGLHARTWDHGLRKREAAYRHLQTTHAPYIEDLVPMGDKKAAATPSAYFCPVPSWPAGPPRYLTLAAPLATRTSRRASDINPRMLPRKQAVSKGALRRSWSRDRSELAAAA